MMLFPFLVLGAIVWALVTFMRSQGRQAPRSSIKETLDARLARGEINKEEYTKLRETLAA